MMLRPVKLSGGRLLCLMAIEVRQHMELSAPKDRPQITSDASSAEMAEGNRQSVCTAFITSPPDIFYRASSEEHVAHHCARHT